MDVVTTISLLAIMNYGEVVSGQPSYGQRSLHTFTNMIRVDPMAWKSEYPCNSNSWSSSERSAKAPLHYHSDLTKIAQLHSEDMESGGFMSHDSSNGTSFSDRVWPYYEGSTIGENVAYGYSDTWTVLVDGWMCSSGHRSNIMESDFEDMGAGVESHYYTQDFGGGAHTGPYPVAMGTHTPETPLQTVTFYTTWHSAQAPALLAVETPDSCLEMSELAGESNRGAWSRETDAGSDCVAYRFFYESADGSTGSLPTNGSYQYGRNCAPWVSDVSAQCDPNSSPQGGGDTGALADTGEDEWQRPPLDRSPPETTGCACTSVKAHPSTLGLLFLGVPLLIGRRRSA